LAISRHASPHGGFLFEIRFPYICALHNEMGMVGQVTVTP
jgi:plastocyanin